MKKVLLLTVNPDETAFSTLLAGAYQKGVEKEFCVAQQVNISRLQFTNTIDNSGITLRNLEPDLMKVRNLILDSDHVVFFVEVNTGKFDFKLYTFLNRLFAIEAGSPIKALWQPSDFATKTARIISVLDNESWKDYQQNGRQITNHPVKKQNFQLFGFAAVRTTALGTVKKGVYNDYYWKWYNKMVLLGEKQY
ncbi:hypothetical protein SAMN05421788_106325 [Filimonas lacunae]|uniref:Uncharacterized protein n=1 Tax=Filimonas lacunae TaxID=477680 RepID=A0A173MFP6_9BACT|nr:hypothetical protein [Filimonas lacunae]BAV06258.1 NAD(P)H dehydrogenase, quinone family [Filimonas lacunae]SIT25512.1 hypothetical protein SAMN05421788_106325 [Filimonas lacunae]